MAEPVIAMRRPAVVDLEPGEYHWCQCGRSKTQPFCDGSHKGSEFAPLAFKVEQKQRIVLCQCKHTKQKPFCDGTHKTLPNP